MRVPPIPVNGDGPGASEADCNQLKADIQRYEDLVAWYNRQLATTSGPLEQRQLMTELATANQFLGNTYANYARNCLPPPRPPIQFEIGSWELVSHLGIEIGDGGWNTGSIWSVCPLPNGQLLIGAEQGGLWLSEPDGHGSYQAQCLSNEWSDWKIGSLLADPAHPTDVFAGCGDEDMPGGLYFGTAPHQPGTWSKIPLPLLIAGSPVTAMIILLRQRILIVATADRKQPGVGGVGWTEIGPFTEAPEGGEALSWNSRNIAATDLAYTKTDLASVEGEEFLLITNENPAVLMRGNINEATLSLTAISPDSIQWLQQPAEFTPIRIASCNQSPDNVYCLGSCKGGISAGKELFILQSTDGGQHWRECQYTSEAVQQLADALDFLDSGVKSDKSIAVHPTDPNTVAVAYGQAALSGDGGGTWTIVSGSHSDIHNLCFDDDGNLFIPSDGGVLSRSPTGVFDSGRNKTLPLLMFYAPAYAREFNGNTACLTDSEMIVAGSQDNANMWLRSDEEPWRQLDAGDGGVVAIYQKGAETFVLHGQGGNNVPVKWAKWAGTDWGASDTVPIRLSGAALDKNGLIPLFRPVSPATGLAVGPDLAPVMALAAPVNNPTVYGAVISNSSVEWRQLGQLTGGETVASLEAYDDSNFLVGTNSGRLFLISLDGRTREFSFDQDVEGAVLGIASDGMTTACFKGDGSRSYLYVNRGPQPFEQLHPNVFPPNDYSSAKFHGVCANRNQKYLRLSFAITVDDNEVWVSNSPIAAVWHKVSEGLPVAVRCADVVFGETINFGQVLLSTYGRSVWRLPFLEL
jgi:hypothetical protein